MAWEPSLGAFYGPVAFIALVTCIYFLCTFIQLRRHPERKYELKSSEEHQRLASADLPPHCHQGPEPGAPTAAAEVGRMHCAGSCGINPALLANEHSFSAQLSTAAFTLFLFLATWTFGALAVTMGHFLDMIFSCLYGAFSVTLGLFVLIHHCAKRDDVWHCWCSCCPGRRGGGPRHGGHGGCSGHGHGHAHGPAHHHHHHHPHGRLKQLNVNGDSLAHGGPLLHCGHLDSACPGSGKGLLGVHTRAPCKLGGLPSPNAAAVACLTPAAAVGPPCCAGLHAQQLLPDEEADGDVDEPTAAHVLLHADPEGYRPAIHLHRCLKGGPGSTGGGSVRTKGRHLSRHRVGGGSEREFAFHLPADGGGSGHSSRANSPHSMLDSGHHHHLHHHPPGGHHLCHEHDLGCVDPHHHHHLHHHHHNGGGSCHEGPHHSCHAALCHARHACCASADLFPTLCPPELVGDAGSFLCGCGKMAAADEEMGMGGHLEMRPRRQSLLQNPSPNQNGILKSSTPESVLYPLDSTGNIRTGPWRNETTV